MGCKASLSLSRDFAAGVRSIFCSGSKSSKSCWVSFFHCFVRGLTVLMFRKLPEEALDPRRLIWSKPARVRFTDLAAELTPVRLSLKLSAASCPKSSVRST